MPTQVPSNHLLLEKVLLGGTGGGESEELGLFEDRLGGLLLLVRGISNLTPTPISSIHVFKPDPNPILPLFTFKASINQPVRSSFFAIQAS